MSKKIFLFSQILFLSFALAFAQNVFEFSDSLVIERLQTDIYTLASEEMEGREAGTPGEKKAAYYIKAQMQEIGLEPLFDNSFLQEFEFFSGYIYGDNSYLKIAGQVFNAGEDFFILPNSGDAEIEAEGIYIGSGLDIPGVINDYEEIDDVEGKILFIEYFSHPESERDIDYDVSALIRMKIETAISKGAAGIIFVNTHGVFNDPRISTATNVAREDIPIIFVKEEVFEFFEQQEMQGYINLSAELIEKSFTAVNVAGYINNNAELTVVIGGHFDHLGYGGPTSRDLQENIIHIGADDNASGTAAVMEAARYYSNNTLDDYNFLFIAFTAEEKGLLGSRYFTESNAYDFERVSFMFNLDMIGRMKDNRLIIIGTGTSPSWDEIIDESKPGHFQVVKSKSGVGGSDHSSFYMKNIPALFFHTGIHEDYHTSTDTPDKINYKGTLETLNLVYNMIEYSVQFGKLEFTPTPVTESRRRRPDAVTLGIMPDHAYDGRGVRIMALVDGRPAQKSGLNAGDIILGIDDMEVKEIHSYMRVLDKLEKGQTVMVLIFRDEEKLLIELEL